MDNCRNMELTRKDFSLNSKGLPENYFLGKLSKKITKVGVDLGLKKAKKEIAKQHGSEVADAMEKQLMQTKTAKKAIKKVENIGTLTLATAAVGGAVAALPALAGGGAAGGAAGSAAGAGTAGAAAGKAGLAALGGKAGLAALGGKVASQVVQKAILGKQPNPQDYRDTDLLNQLKNGDEIVDDDKKLLAGFGDVNPIFFAIGLALLLILMMSSGRNKQFKRR